MARIDSELRWFPAYVRCGQEIKTRDMLRRFDIEHFVPTEYRVNSHRRKTEYPLINSLVFIHSTRECALSFKIDSGVRLNYMADPGASGQQLVVPDSQMNDFIRVLSSPDRVLTFSTEAGHHLGSIVQVTAGPLKGVQGKVVRSDGRHYIVVSILGSINAHAAVPSVWLRKV